MRENADQKNSEYGHFSRSGKLHFLCRGITIEHVNMKIRNRKTFYLILFVLYSWKFYQHHSV